MNDDTDVGPWGNPETPEIMIATQRAIIRRNIIRGISYGSLLYVLYGVLILPYLKSHSPLFSQLSVDDIAKIAWVTGFLGGIIIGKTFYRNERLFLVVAIAMLAFSYGTVDYINQLLEMLSPVAEYIFIGLLVLLPSVSPILSYGLFAQKRG